MITMRGNDGENENANANPTPRVLLPPCHDNFENAAPVKTQALGQDVTRRLRACLLANLKRHENFITTCCRLSAPFLSLGYPVVSDHVDANMRQKSVCHSSCLLGR